MVRLYTMVEVAMVEEPMNRVFAENLVGFGFLKSVPI